MTEPGGGRGEIPLFREEYRSQARGQFVVIKFLRMIAMIVMILLFFGFALHPPAVMWSPRKTVGAVITGLSVPLLLQAHWQLGASFSVKAKARALVTTGIYSKIRNPIYLFSGLVLVGLSLFLSIWGPVVVALVLVPLQTYRARKEERVLAAAFGEKYQTYKKNTWF
jgi:protein-S-isoprenylcysteine O-methyltransferase Ste14